MIFLHSSFRTSSTWFWTKFREQEKFLSYYEVFNQFLGTLTIEEANTSDYQEWDTRHPPTAPYFQEYVPLIRDGGGVQHFSPDMAYNRFIPATGINGDISEAEKTYLASLIHHAESLGKVPVLSGTRSLGRVGGIKRALGGTHILLYRNPFHQWCSYSEQFLRQNFSFVESVRDTLLSNPHDPFMAEVCRSLDIQNKVIDNNKLIVAFVLLHLYLYAQSAGHFDMLIDVNRLAQEPVYRQAIEAETAARCGAVFDLSDARQSLGANLTLIGNRQEVETILEPWLSHIVAAAPTELGRHLAIKGYLDFLNEYERHFFHVSPIVRAWKPILTAWDTGKSMREDEIARLKAECEEMQASLSWRLTAPLRSIAGLFRGKKQP